MITHSIGDQSRAYTTRLSISRVKSDLAVLAEEISSHQTADVGRKLSGNLRALNAIDARFTAVDRYDKNAAEVSVLLDRKQQAISLSQDISKKLFIPLLDQSLTNSSGLIAVRAEEGVKAFRTVVAQMNSQVAGQTLFAGLATDRPPLVSADSMLSELSELAEGKNTAEDISKIVSEWFDAESGKGGYLDFAYKGTLGDGEIRNVRISESHEINMQSVTAADPVIRDVLKGLAMLTLLEKDGLNGKINEQTTLIGISGRVLRENNDALVAVEGKIGLQQETLQNSKAENKATLATLNIARNDIVLIDEEEGVVKLLEVSRHLSVMYEMTSRLSQLSLSEFLR